MESEYKRKCRKDFEDLFKEPFMNFGGTIILIVIIYLICN